MAWVRILVDGYSLLHRWTRLAPGRPRHSQAARSELIRRLTLYQDATGIPVTVVFDGAARRGRAELQPSGDGVEVLFSPPRRTADDLIERAALRLAAGGPVRVVTDDMAEAETVLGGGGWVCSCSRFIREVEDELSATARKVGQHNQRERSSFARRA